MGEAEQIAGFGVWRWELPSGRVRWSGELHRIYGVAPGEFDGTVQGFISFLHPDDRDRIWVLIQRAVDRCEPFAFQERIVRADGRVRVLLSRGRPVAGPDGRVTALVGICHDITERVEAQRALGHNERRIRAIVDNSPSVVAVKDLEGRYLMANAECARLLGLQPDDLIGRTCAELFPQISAQLRENDRRAAAELEPVYDEMVLTVEDQERTYLTVTFALLDDAGRPVETCVIATDVTDGKEQEAQRRERVEWTRRIESALSEGRMVVYAQPIVAVATAEPKGYELLVRMRSPDVGAGLILPGQFLPAAERLGLIQAIDVFVVRQALSLAGQFAPSVNLSAVTLCDRAARNEIVALLAGAPSAARGLLFEITETAAVGHLDAAREFAQDITAHGCGLALDDFGTGFGSFTYLRTLPLRYLKIDASFVRNLVSSRDDQRVVKSIMGIAEQYNLRTIAEGVEDQRTFEFLRELGADYAQGFALGRPAPAPVPLAIA